MNDFEKKILQSYVDTIKSIGGRGPKNIFIKIDNKRVEIHFTLVKSQLELFILNNFENATMYLADMYSQIQTIIIRKTIEDIWIKTGVEMHFVEFSIDVLKDKFCLALEMDSPSTK